MNPVFRAVVMFAILWMVFRIGGRRTLAEITTFDFILLLVIGDAAQNALVGDDFSITTASLVVVTLLLLDLGMGRLGLLSKTMNRSHRQRARDRHRTTARCWITRCAPRASISMKCSQAARERHGLERLDDIKYAIVERHGGISIIPATKS